MKARPATTSSFTSAALARLPKSGQGSSTFQPTFVRPSERAKDISSTRAVFESNKQTALLPKRTVPLHGRTPGKASRERAKKREEFDQSVRANIEEKERIEREERRRLEFEEEEEYRKKRKETVIWAKGVPGMYTERKA